MVIADRVFANLAYRSLERRRRGVFLPWCRASPRLAAPTMKLQMAINNPYGVKAVSDDDAAMMEAYTPACVELIKGCQNVPEVGGWVGGSGVKLCEIEHVLAGQVCLAHLP